MFLTDINLYNNNFLYAELERAQNEVDDADDDTVIRSLLALKAMM